MASELIIQIQSASGNFSCELYENFPGRRAAYIVICFTDNIQSEQLAIVLKQELLNTLFNLQPAFKSGVPKCNGVAQSFLGCYALQNPDASKLLIVVSDGNSNTFVNPSVLNWTESILPVFQRSHFISFPSPLNTPNAIFWDNNISEILPVVLGKVEVVDEDYKIFISYKRSDTNEFAEQLYDSLNHDGFEVFLDRFSINPGINFQERLYQELADKAVVVVLESINYLQSKWVQYEIAFAKKYKLGIIAININNSPKTPSIDDEYRYTVTNTDFDKNNKLNDSILVNMVAEIKKAHAIALYRKKYSLTANIFKALIKQNLTPKFDKNGFIEVQNITNSKNYKIWASVRPPVINDYHFSDTSYPNDEKILLGPKFVEGKREMHNKWLSIKTGIIFYNEPEIIKMSKRVSKGI